MHLLADATSQALAGANATNIFITLAFAISGTVIAAIGFAQKWGDRKNKNLVDASTTWKSVADSLRSENEDLKLRLADREQDVRNLSWRNDELWRRLGDDRGRDEQK